MVETECSIYLRNHCKKIERKFQIQALLLPPSVFNLKQNKNSQRDITIRLVKILLMDEKASHMLSNTQQTRLSKIIFATSKFVLSGARSTVLASY